MANSPSSSRSGPIRTGCLVGRLADGFVKSEQPISVAMGSGEADGSDVACPEGLPGLAECHAPTASSRSHASRDGSPSKPPSGGTWRWPWRGPHSPAPLLVLPGARARAGRVALIASAIQAVFAAVGRHCLHGR